jgi:trimeric autotransporter adhesin
MVDSRQKEITKLKEAVRKYQQDNLVNQKKSVYGALFQNDPNPFASSTEIQMELPEVTRHASLIIYNLEGKQLKNIQVKERGATTIKISGSEFNPGMYLYALIADGKVVDTKRLILTK